MSMFPIKFARERGWRAKRMRAAWLFGVLFLLGMDTPEFASHRKIEAAPGWNQVELPAEVIATAKPGLADVRILASNGEEIPFSKGRELPAPSTKLPLVDVERGSETTALLDRGPKPALLEAVELVVEEHEFIKPVKLEGSDDRATWLEFAEGSIFATSSGVRMTSLRFAANDRRYWRFRFDDRNGARVTPTHVIIRPTGHNPACSVLRANAKPEADSGRGFSTYEVTLPHAHLPVVDLRIQASDAAYVRQARVFERIWFRNEVSRRLLGEGEIASAPAKGPKNRVLVTEPTGTTLQVDIERSGSAALHDVIIDLCVEPRFLYFHLPPDTTAELAYGADVGPTEYDVEVALAEGRPAQIARATLGAPVESGTETRSLPEITRGATLEMKGWKHEYPIALPAKGPIAYLDVDPDLLQTMRIVDKAGRQVPYVVETEWRHTQTEITTRVAPKTDANTTVYLDGVPAGDSLDAIELEVSAPEYFSRNVSVIEELFDARGRTGEQTLGHAKLTRTASSRSLPLRISTTAPGNREHLAIRIHDGDNAPLTVSAAMAVATRRRVDFVFESGDELRLVHGNDRATTPLYDVALVAGKVLEAPAEPATLGAMRVLVEPKIVVPVWFWGFVFAAAVVLLLVLARTLTQPPVAKT